jgi:hypothetical protein
MEEAFVSVQLVIFFFFPFFPFLELLSGAAPRH